MVPIEEARLSFDPLALLNAMLGLVIFGLVAQLKGEDSGIAPKAPGQASGSKSTTQTVLAQRRASSAHPSSVKTI